MVQCPAGSCPFSCPFVGQGAHLFTWCKRWARVWLQGCSAPNTRVHRPCPSCTSEKWFGHLFISQRLGGELPASLHQEGAQPPRVQGMHYGFT